MENPFWDEYEPELDKSQPLLTLGKAEYFKDEIEDDIINGFISNPFSVTSIENLREEEAMEDLSFEHMKTTTNIKRSLVEMEPGKHLSVNLNLTIKLKKLLQLSQK